MLFDNDSLLIRSDLVSRIRNAARDLATGDLTTDEIYLKYRLYLKSDRMTAEALMNKHVINWLYTIRCEIGEGGLRYVDNILQQLRYTLKRDLTEEQFEYVKLIIDCFFIQRNLYVRNWRDS